MAHRKALVVSHCVTCVTLQEGPPRLVVGGKEGTPLQDEGDDERAVYTVEHKGISPLKGESAE